MGSYRPLLVIGSCPSGHKEDSLKFIPCMHLNGNPARPVSAAVPYCSGLFIFRARELETPCRKGCSRSATSLPSCSTIVPSLELMARVAY